MPNLTPHLGSALGWPNIGKAELTADHGGEFDVPHTHTLSPSLYCKLSGFKNNFYYKATCISCPWQPCPGNPWLDAKQGSKNNHQLQQHQPIGLSYSHTHTHTHDLDRKPPIGWCFSATGDRLNHSTHTHKYVRVHTHTHYQNYLIFTDITWNLVIEIEGHVDVIILIFCLYSLLISNNLHWQLYWVLMVALYTTNNSTSVQGYGRYTSHTQEIKSYCCLLSGTFKNMNLTWICFKCVCARVCMCPPPGKIPSHTSLRYRGGGGGG